MTLSACLAACLSVSLPATLSLSRFIPSKIKGNATLGVAMVREALALVGKGDEEGAVVVLL